MFTNGFKMILGFIVLLAIGAAILVFFTTYYGDDQRVLPDDVTKGIIAN